MVSRIFQLFIDSFKLLFREKINFYISSFTISICLIVLVLTSNISFKLISKIDTIDRPPLLVTYEDMYFDCDDCPINEKFEDIDPMNGVWDIAEKFEDLNGSGTYDTHEPCPECDIYSSKFLNPLSKDSNSDIDIKSKCKDCIENKLGMQDGDCFSDYELILGCDSECSPDSDSKYNYDQYNESEYFNDLNNNGKWDVGLEPFINNDYFGSRIKTKCRGCLHFKYLEARNNVRFMDNINNEIDYTDKNEALVNYEVFWEGKYFEVDPSRLRIPFPVQSEFEIDEIIDNKQSLDSLIFKVTDLKSVKNINPESMLDYSTFISYQQLSRIITSSIPVLIFFILLIPFFIVSNTIRLVIHSKREVLNTLQLLGEKDIYIKLPFIFQGIWQGFIGSVLAIFFIYYLNFIGFSDILNNIMNTVITQSSINITNTNLIESFSHISMILFLGVILGIFGSVRGIAKYLK
tara:strand:- start:1639 stop:3024 length:1386 start_codon:yes stop_codon:yes gene_type:complete